MIWLVPSLFLEMLSYILCPKNFAQHTDVDEKMLKLANRFAIMSFLNEQNPVKVVAVVSHFIQSQLYSFASLLVTWWREL